jgi:hypothetical protein
MFIDTTAAATVHPASTHRGADRATTSPGTKLRRLGTAATERQRPVASVTIIR